MYLWGIIHEKSRQVTINTTVTITRDGRKIPITLTGEAIAEGWPPEFQDWDLSHISITEIHDGYNAWSQEYFDGAELRFFRLELWKAARAKSAPQPFAKLNIRELLNLSPAK